MSSSDGRAARSGLWPDYRSVWRWHFYAGLFCIPFVLWLAATGTIYLFKPQIERWLDAPYDGLVLSAAPQPASAQVAAAVGAVAGGRFKAYELPAGPQSAARVLVADGARTWRVYVHPQTLAVLARVDDDARPMRVVSKLHGTLWMGVRGSNLVELAACWAIVMVLSGLFLWWPRGSARWAGVLVPRLGGGRRLWRDLHAVAGFWISALALFLMLSGLPWAQFWGGNLKAVRAWAASAPARQDWTLGGQPVVPPVDEHAHHRHVVTAGSADDAQGAALDAVAATAVTLSLPAPVLISPPSAGETDWSLRSDTQNRPLRTSLRVDAGGRIVSREDFAQRALLDRIIGTGIAAHEGQLFGVFNQLLGLLTTSGLVLLCVSALAMWWKRRPLGVLGAPPAIGEPRYAAVFFALVIVLGLLLPLMGVSLLLVLAVERLLLRRVPRLRVFLGLRAPA